ncbi:hypothetical protein BM1_04111 [Bipolaris maydis]|nr:hypothetical protein BM1_04111 [Bipolaris maydis]
MASASFRESMNSLGWSRRESQAPVSTAPPSLLDRIQNLNPFGEGGYVRLPTTETNPGAPLPAPTRREEEEGWFAQVGFPVFPLLDLSSAPAPAPAPALGKVTAQPTVNVTEGSSCVTHLACTTLALFTLSVRL